MNADEIKDGGSAFPLIVDIKPFGVANYEGKTGMTLRDYFAGEALPAAIREAMNHNASLFYSPLEVTSDRVADACYRYADAMIKRREKGGAS